MSSKRADAERNRSRILEVGRCAFAEPGPEVSMAEISRRAGVGMATLYRNFPGRRELLEALYAEEVDAICEAAGSVPGETPGARLDVWLEDLFTFANSRRHVAADLLEECGQGESFGGENRDRVLAAGRPLFEAALSSGEVREGLRFAQVLDIFVAIATIQGDCAHVVPILRTTLYGLRPATEQSRSATPLS